MKFLERPLTDVDKLLTSAMIITCPWNEDTLNKAKIPEVSVRNVDVNSVYFSVPEISINDALRSVSSPEF